jgi:hypothetical protein
MSIQLPFFDSVAMRKMVVRAERARTAAAILAWLAA